VAAGHATGASGPLAIVALVGLPLPRSGDARLRLASDSTLGPNAGFERGSSAINHIWVTGADLPALYNLPLIAFGWLR